MIQSRKYYAVNWVDGMKVSREHLLQQEDFVIDSIRDANSLRINDFNYGVLPLPKQLGNDDNMLYDIQSTATNDAQLIIKKCMAVTLAGHRIELADYKVNIRDLVNEMPIDKGGEEEELNGDFYIMAFVNPFDKKPFGEINSEEIPPRHPYTKPAHRIELVDVSVLDNNYTGGDHLILGKVTIKSGIAQIDHYFIPPCTSVQSHPKLVEYHNMYTNSMGNLRQYAFKIIQKRGHKNQNSELASNVKTLCRTMIAHIGENYFEFKNAAPTQPPIYMMNIFSKLALQLYNDTQLMIPSELEEMLNYCSEWSDVGPNAFLRHLTKNAEINYEHQQTGENFLNLGQMLKSLEQVFGKLSELDYIGQRRENVIVNEEEVKSNDNPKKGWSVID